MRIVKMTTPLSGAPDDVFERICDFERYPELTDAVRSVVVTPHADGTLASAWEVNFRNGILRWSETDRVDHEQRTIDFEQLDGDFEAFTGRWSVAPRDGGGCTVGFEAAFDLGMPTLAAMLDPIAEGALRENVARILDGLTS
jgi:ribosome-associated toxin RatA of RatAB toxin-antitoxin module